MAEDSIMIAGKVCTAGSKILKNFKVAFNATAYEKCIQNNIEFVGQVIPNEFGIDNLFDNEEKLTASITALTDKKCDFILCNDVFGHLRCDAPKHNLIYIHPAYGTVSRFGLVPTVSSMDQIGVLCRNLDDGIKVFSIISGHDSRDGTSLPNDAYNFDAKDETATIQTAENVSFKYLDVLPQVFYILAAAEICNNTNRYDGIKFGCRAQNTKDLDELYKKTRTEGLGRDVCLASIVGCMVLSQEHYNAFYNKAMQVRRLVYDYYNTLLTNIDVLQLPTVSEGKYKQLSIYALPVLCGLSSISLPNDNQLICKQGKESMMFETARRFL